MCETIKKTAFKVTRVGQLVAQEASKRLGVPFGIVDLSLAPTPAIGDSVADILCEIGLEYAGALLGAAWVFTYPGGAQRQSIAGKADGYGK